MTKEHKVALHLSHFPWLRPTSHLLCISPASLGFSQPHICSASLPLPLASANLISALHLSRLPWLQPTSYLLCISPASLGFICVPAAPHTGLGEHQQPGSSLGRQGNRLPRLPASLGTWPLSLCCSCWVTRLQAFDTRPLAPGRSLWSHSHEEEVEGEEGPALWAARVTAWQQGYSCHGNGLSDSPSLSQASKGKDTPQYRLS